MFRSSGSAEHQDLLRGVHLRRPPRAQRHPTVSPPLFQPLYPALLHPTDLPDQERFRDDPAGQVR